MRDERRSRAQIVSSEGDKSLNGNIPLSIIKERASDHTSVEALMDRAFGKERKDLTAYRLRSPGQSDKRLCYVAVDQRGEMRGSLRFWRVGVGDLSTGSENTGALLLGPLAIEPDYRGRGVARTLIARGLDDAALLGYGLCFVVGDPPIYASFGFTNATALGFALPGPVDRHRFLLKELTVAAADTFAKGPLFALSPPHEAEQKQQTQKRK